MRQVFDLENETARPRETATTLRKTRAWAYLSERDRTILEMVERGVSHRLIGQAIGRDAGTVSRRLVLIRTRLHSPLARLALDPTSPLSADSRESVVLHAVTGLGLREIARHRQLPLTAVTEHVRYAQGVARGLSARR